MHLAREPGGPASAGGRGDRRPHREVRGHTPMMDGCGKSDSLVVPGKPPNNAEEPAAEVVEGRGLAKGNLPERNVRRTQSRESTPSALERVREAARRDRKQRFTALLHHVYAIERLRVAYWELKGDSASVLEQAMGTHHGEYADGN